MIPEQYFKWYIAGIGAMGSLLAAHFFKEGLPIQLVLKDEEQSIQYKREHLTLITEKIMFTCEPSAIEMNKLDNQPIHYLICCVKAHAITALLKKMSSNLTDNCIVILIHNGLGVIDEITQALPQLRIIHGISTLGAYMEKPYTSRAFLGGDISLGQVRGEFTEKEIITVCAAFTKARIPCRWYENIQEKIWDKFIINCSINLLTGLFACKNGQLIEHDKLLKQLITEIAAVSVAHGMMTSAEHLFDKVTQVLKHTANNYSSMYMDILNNKPTEIGYLNEQLMTLAQQKNIPTPLHSKLLNQFYIKFPKYNC